MTVVKLFKTENAQPIPAAVFDDGEYTIGRGSYLTDKRISRRHGILKVSKDAVTLTAAHQNPCYYKNESGVVQMLPMGQSITLKDEDEFSFLKENSWLKIKISQETQADNESSVFDPSIAKPLDGTVCNKRKNSFDSPETPQKVARTEDSSNVASDKTELNGSAVNIRESPTTQTEQHDENDLIETREIKAESIASEGSNYTALDVILDQIKKENTEEADRDSDAVQHKPSSEHGGGSCIEDIKQETENTPTEELVDGDTGAETSAEKRKEPTHNGDKASGEKPKRKWRDRCWYGKKCYRKNAEHKATFTHPGDSDYDSDPNDDRPSCSYGAACYRRNPVHRQDYRHPSNGGKPPQAKRTRVKPKKQARTADEEDDAEDDDYDLDDPFINDDSEDEFEPEDDDDTDSDWEDSQEMAEDEDTKQLLKEAKRITRNMRKK